MPHIVRSLRFAGLAVLLAVVALPAPAQPAAGVKPVAQPPAPAAAVLPLGSEGVAVGFLASSAAAYAISSRLGLLNRPDSGNA